MKEEEEEELPVLMLAWMQQYKNSNTTLKEARLTTRPNDIIDNIKANRITKPWKQKWEEKLVYGYFKRQSWWNNAPEDMDMTTKGKP